MARNEVIVVCRETSKFSVTAIGLGENISMANASYHLTSRIKQLHMDALAFKNKYDYAFCWVKSGSIFSVSLPILVLSELGTSNISPT